MITCLDEGSILSFLYLSVSQYIQNQSADRTFCYILITEMGNYVNQSVLLGKLVITMQFVQQEKKNRNFFQHSEAVKKQNEV